MLAFTISTRRFFRTCDFIVLIEYFQQLRFGIPVDFRNKCDTLPSKGSICGSCTRNS